MDPTEYAHYTITPGSPLAALWEQFKADYRAHHKAVADLLKTLGVTHYHASPSGILHVNLPGNVDRKGWVKARGRGVSSNSYKPSKTNEQMKAAFASPIMRSVDGWELQRRVTGVDDPFMYRRGLRMRTLTIGEEYLPHLVLRIPNHDEPGEGFCGSIPWQPTEHVTPLPLSDLYELMAAKERAKELPVG